jgi:hypothetical protein
VVAQSHPHRHLTLSQDGGSTEAVMRAVERFLGDERIRYVTPGRHLGEARHKSSLFVIGGCLDTAAIGAFEAPMRMCTSLSYPGLALAAAIAPHFARTGQGASGAPQLAKAIRLLLIGHAAVAGIVLVWAGPIAHVLLGGGYPHSEAVLRG